jgi:DNA-3-methyladenine glycosylase I
MLQYHDREWGVPVHNDRKHFEFLVLSVAQAGLNFSVVLKKREGYRRAFDRFDPQKVAYYSPARIQKLISDPEIIRNKMKIEAAVPNPRLSDIIVCATTACLRARLRTEPRPSGIGCAITYDALF